MPKGVVVMTMRPRKAGTIVLKSKLFMVSGFRVDPDAKYQVFEYIEVYYNHKRLHSKSGYISPETFKAKKVAYWNVREIEARSNFGRADFRIGYYDRIEHSLVLKALTDIKFPKDSYSAFEWNDNEGETHTIPLHRIKAVYRNGELIWQWAH